jgi:hypothetical protein
MRYRGDLRFELHLNDYWYCGHSRIIAASDSHIGWSQGFGFFTLRVTRRGRQPLPRAETVDFGSSRSTGLAPRHWEVPAVYPHCDDLVMHAPGECVYCDKYPISQDFRERYGINFTGHHDPAKEPCPSERRRSLETINRWPGNRPHLSVKGHLPQGRS